MDNWWKEEEEDDDGYGLQIDIFPGLFLFFFFYAISTPLKNGIDRSSRPPNVWAGKLAAIISTGGGFGGGGSLYHLQQIVVFFDLHFINRPELCIIEFKPPQKFDSDGNLIHNESNEKLEQDLLSLQAFTHRLKGKSRNCGDWIEHCLFWGIPKSTQL
ncbi:NADPH:quinone oxidoreductase-like protein [Cinnamomum micranthum f. kanehirae]|uniref:NAD(P)H dehydrogenase (quinone) n=1 Tax=Cinnamomum micranthum f. kanehirae TaxID=337451 RepID=A0A443PDH1_9MAGN|nr:NADPH:quinone oxidoreductase-like protein [Cinnamomum micranthum f. kanehirae]